MLLAGSVLASLLLALAVARHERRRRLSRQRWLRDRLERAVGPGLLHEGRLAFLRPASDARPGVLRTHLGAGRDLLDPSWSLHARLGPSRTEAPGERGADLALVTARGVLALGAPVAVVFGHALRGPSRGWELREGETVLAAARLADQNNAAGFRTTGARAELTAALPAGYPALVPLLGVGLPALRRSVFAAASALLGALSLGTTLAAVRLTRSAHAPVATACADAATAALEQNDPAGALRQLAGCDAPRLEARAHWLLGDFASASDAFGRIDADESSASEVEAHALAGRHDRAARAARRLPLHWFAHVDERECLATAFEARSARGLDAGPLRQPRSLCRALGRDLVRLGLLPADQAPSDAPTWQRRAVTDDVLLALDATAPGLSAHERLVRGLQATSLPVLAVTDVRAYLRHRPLALHRRMLRDAVADGAEQADALAGSLHAHERAARDLVQVRLGLEQALRQAYVDPGEAHATLAEAAAHRGLLSAHHDEAQADPARDPVTSELRSYSDRHALMLQAWAAYHAGLDSLALSTARSSSDVAGTRTLELWSALRAGDTFTAAAWREVLDREPLSPGRDLLERSVDGDARPVVAWLRDHHQDGHEALGRLVTRLTGHRDDLADFVARRPVHGWTSGLGALLEHTADQVLLARRLGPSPLDDQRRALLGRLVRLRLDEGLEVPFLLIEQFVDY